MATNIGIVEWCLKQFQRWFDTKSKEKLEEKIRDEYRGPGVRVQYLDRRSPQAVTTWLARYYDLGFNIQLGLDSAEGMVGKSKKNKLSTHVVIVKKITYRSFEADDLNDSFPRRTPMKILLSSEGIFRPIYNENRVDEAANIINTVAKLLTKERIDPDYFTKYHPEIDPQVKRDAEIAIAIGISAHILKRQYPHVKPESLALIAALMQNPDVPKRLLYPPDLISTEAALKAMITMVARYRYASSTFVVFPHESA